jgi:hypothetical protein
VKTRAAPLGWEAPRAGRAHKDRDAHRTAPSEHQEPPRHTYQV